MKLKKTKLKFLGLFGAVAVVSSIAASCAPTGNNEVVATDGKTGIDKTQKTMSNQDFTSVLDNISDSYNMNYFHVKNLQDLNSSQKKSFSDAVRWTQGNLIPTYLAFQDLANAVKAGDINKITEILKATKIITPIKNNNNPALNDPDPKADPDLWKKLKTDMDNLYPNASWEVDATARMYFAGNFNSGWGSTNETHQSAAVKAFSSAFELMYRKEEQASFDSANNVIPNSGFQNSSLVRISIQKAVYLATAVGANYPQYYQNGNIPGNRLVTNPYYQDSAEGAKANEAKQQVIKVLEDFLDNVTSKYYYPNQIQYVNWWFYEIGIPKDLTKLLVAASYSVPSAKIAQWANSINYFLPDVRYGGASPTAILAYRPVTSRRLQTGANLVDNANILLQTAILERNSESVNNIFTVLADNLFNSFVTSSDGFYADGSFIQHSNLAYIGSYGVDLFKAFSSIVLYFDGSDFNIQHDPRFLNVYKFIETSIMPYMFNGSIADNLSGRAVVRDDFSSQKQGLTILASLTVLLDNAPAQYGPVLHNFILNQVKGITNLSSLISTYNISAVLGARLLAIQTENKELPTTPRTDIDWQYYETNSNADSVEWLNLNQEQRDRLNASTGNKNFSLGGYDLLQKNNGLVFSKNQNRYAWNQDGFGFYISLHDQKNGMFESTLGENESAFYQSDGATALYTTANSNPYGNGYWQLINPYYVPGTSAIDLGSPDVQKDAFLTSLKAQFASNPSSVDAKYLTASKQLKNDFQLTQLFMTDRATESEKLNQQLNYSYNNGLIFDQTGMVQAKVDNYQRKINEYGEVGVTTNKAYFMINGSIIVVGNTHAHNKSDSSKVVTTIENLLDNASTKITKGTVSLNGTAHDQYKIGTNDYTILQNQNNVKSGSAAKVSTAVYADTALMTSANAIKAKYMNSTGFVTPANNTFNTLWFDNSTDNTFAYAITPNANDNLAATLSNIQIIANDENYVAIKYTDPTTKAEYYYVSTFADASLKIKQAQSKNISFDSRTFDPPYLKLDGINTELKSVQPTSLILKKDANNKISGMVSASLPETSYSVEFRGAKFNSINSRDFSGNKEVVLSPSSDGSSLLLVNNQLGKFNDYLHNAWFEIN
ncbi:hypothetical protein [[Mycoplasma] testudinis]|uniref:hypothetical protein n=1 Tax=[Mycoplasma] testudinis TaxID=33924 RepID=UPI000483F950|nr:hypothetical protein [[Mycoplasma] testudinis]